MTASNDGILPSLAVLSVRITPFVVLAIAFLLIPLYQLDGLKRIPGDLGDALLNNYFLEHAYQFLSGKLESLWDMPFFYPFPYVLGFSDNLFGTVPLYALFRILGAEPDTSFQLWFLAGYIANFTACYFALTVIGASRIAATLGALIFTFALPVTAHAGHAQLHYRFGLPLALAYFTRFLDDKQPRAFNTAGFWLVWQFYAGVYMGFFTLLLIAASTLVFLISRLLPRNPSLKQEYDAFLRGWHQVSTWEKGILVGTLSLLLVAVLFLFYPYLIVQGHYGASRSWNEITTMLPRWQSYFTNDASLIWGRLLTPVLPEVPMRHEHQMFPGLTVYVLAFLGLWIGFRRRAGLAFILLGGALLVTIFITLFWAGTSIWRLLHNLPLASAIRAMSRVDLALLFPLAFLAAQAIDHIKDRWRQSFLVLGTLSALMFVEFAASTLHSDRKDDWRSQIVAKGANVPADLPKDAILFFAQKGEPYYVEETTSMWVALRHRRPTLNGYSGLLPPHFNLQFGQDCAEGRRRLVSYLHFVGKSDEEGVYRNLAARVVPVDFDNCKAG